MWGQPPPAVRSSEARLMSGVGFLEVGYPVLAPSFAARSRISAGTFLDTRARHPPHSAHRPPAPHLSANNYRDKSPRVPAAFSTPPDNAPAVRFACTDRTPRRNSVPRSTRSPTSVNPRSWRQRIPADTAANPNLHFEESACRHARPLVARQSRTCAYAPDAAVQWAKAQAVH